MNISAYAPDLEPNVMTKSNDYSYHIYEVSPVQDRGIKIFREEPTYLFHISCVGENQSREFQSFSLQTEILILSPTGMTGKETTSLMSFGMCPILRNPSVRR